MGKSLLYKGVIVGSVAWVALTVYLLKPDLFKGKHGSTDDGGPLSEMRHRMDLLPSDHVNHQSHRACDGNKTCMSVGCDGVMDPVHVCLTSDERTIIGLITTINSVWKNTACPVHFHLLLDAAIVKDVRDWISKTPLKAINYDVKIFDGGQLRGLLNTTAGHENKMDYARYFYAEMLPDVHGLIVHLDTDVIVQSDIRELVTSTFLNNTVAAFADDCSTMSKHLTPYNDNYAAFFNFNNAAVKKLHMKPTKCTFNAGVYVADIDKWRSLNMTNQLLHWMRVNLKEKLYGGEKAGGGALPPLMIVFYQNYTKLHPQWHVKHLGWRIGGEIFSESFIRHSKLLHWSGHHKPWEGMSQYTSVWDRYYVTDPSGKYLPTRRMKSAPNKIA